MGKELISACLALVALAAFALPATASATNDPDLTHPTGTKLATGTKITGTSIFGARFKDFSGNTLVECSVARMTGTLTKNNGTEVEGNIESTSFSGTGANGECTSTFGGITVDTNIGNGTPWCLRSTGAMATDEFQVRGNSCSNAARSITFVLTSTTVGTCKYNRAFSLSGSYRTDTGTEGNFDAYFELTSGFNEFVKEEGGIFCPSSSGLEMTFTLETDSFMSEPFYIS